MVLFVHRIEDAGMVDVIRVGRKVESGEYGSVMGPVCS
jgi:hypothetical protein